MKKLLTNKKHAWVKQYKHTGLIRGTTLYHNAAATAKYNQALQDLVDEMCKTTEKRIRALFSSNTAEVYFAQDDSIAGQAKILTNDLTDTYNQLFSRKSKMLATRMVNNEDQVSKTNLHQSLKEMSGGLLLKTDFLTGDMNQMFSAIVDENVSLIKSIPAQYFTQMKGAVMRSISTGNGLEDLIPFFAKQKGITKRRAKNIALDQTRKTYNALNDARSQKVGIKKGEWIHSGGGLHPRDTHIALSGTIYNLADGAYDPDVGYNIKPGQLPFCGCTFRPVIEFNEGKQ